MSLESFHIKRERARDIPSAMSIHQIPVPHPRSSTLFGSLIGARCSFWFSMIRNMWCAMSS